MDLNIGKELAALQRLTVKELRNRYAEVYGEPTNANNRAWLVKRIAWRLQALAEGDLSERARRRAAELASDTDLRMNPPKALSAAPARRGPPLTSSPSSRTPGSCNGHRKPEGLL